MRSKERVNLKIVLDTSVCVAALLSTAGGSAKILEAIFEGRLNNFHTDETLQEINRVLRRKKFNLEKEKLEHFLHLFSETSFLVKPLDEFRLSQCRDPKDDIFLSLSNQVDADFLVTLDLDLSELKEVGRTKIVSPGQFLKCQTTH